MTPGEMNSVAIVILGIALVMHLLTHWRPCDRPDDPPDRDEGGWHASRLLSMPSGPPPSPPPMPVERRVPVIPPTPAELESRYWEGRRALRRLVATAALAGIILAVGWFVEAMNHEWLYMAGTLVGLWLAEAWRTVWS